MNESRERSPCPSDGTATVRGFILTRQWKETAEGQSLIFWMATDRGPVRVTVPDQESVFFVSAMDIERVVLCLRRGVEWRYAELQLETFEACDRVKAVACYFPNQSAMHRGRHRLGHQPNGY